MSEDFDGGHFEKCPKRWGRPNLYGVNISIIDQWGPLNKMIPLMEDPGGGGGCTVTPLGPWTICDGCTTKRDNYINRQTGQGQSALNGAVHVRDFKPNSNNLWDPLLFLANNDDNIKEHLTDMVREKRGVKWSLTLIVNSLNKTATETI